MRDVNGDGYDDAMVGARKAGSMNEGKVYAYYGSSSRSGSISPDVTITGATSSGYLGYSVGSGDFNGDGCYDAIIGAESASVVYIHYGSAEGLDDEPGQSFIIIPSTNGLGYGVGAGR
jgi:hypothetical protein